ncbi:MAG TPA: hypothetical protein PJ986_12795 [Gammaproteobacteria bacterium]|nr:hypothetical protein [Gammaproteobacteria bacterium]
MLESGYSAPIGRKAASVLRRYEFPAFSAEYKAEDHEAILAFDDSHPHCIDDPSRLYDPDMPNVGANLVETPRPVPAPPAIALFVSTLARCGLRRRSAP